MTDFDAIVLGLGGMGSAAARALSRRGARVLGLERFGPAHELGSSHGDTRIVRMAYFEKPDYVPLLRRSYQLWDELSSEVGRDLFARTGALMIGAPDTAVVAGTLASVQRWDLPHEVLDTAAMAARYPQFALRPGEMAVLEADAGWVDPQDAVRAHLELAARDGADLRFELPVHDWETTSDGVRVRTAHETFTANRLVVAAGPWTSSVVPTLAVPMRVVRRVMHYMQPVVSADDFDAGRFPVYIFQTDPGDEIYGFPLVGPADTGVKVGFHHRGPAADPDTIDRVVSPAEQEEMRALLAERIPGLAGPHVQAKVCMYTVSPDEHFVIEHLAGTNGRVSVAAGFSGHGFKFTPVVGEILADLALDGTTPLPIDFLSSARFAAL